MHAVVDAASAEAKEARDGRRRRGATLARLFAFNGFLCQVQSPQDEAYGVTEHKHGVTRILFANRGQMEVKIESHGRPITPSTTAARAPARTPMSPLLLNRHYPVIARAQRFRQFKVIRARYAQCRVNQQNHRLLMYVMSRRRYNYEICTMSIYAHTNHATSTNQTALERLCWKRKIRVARTGLRQHTDRDLQGGMNDTH